MIKESFEVKSMALISIIIVITLLSTVELQPVAIGDIVLTSLDSDTNICQKNTATFLEILKGKHGILFPWWLIKTPKHNYKLTTFSSYEELLCTIQQHQNQWATWHDGLVYDAQMSPSTGVKRTNAGLSAEGVLHYSQTNIQVAGVDEPDFVKTDGSYMYILIQKTVYIIKAYPVGEAQLLSTISIETKYHPEMLFINGDHLIVFSQSYGYSSQLMGDTAPLWWGRHTETTIQIYDVEDKEHPSLESEITIDGDFCDARMIDEYVYVVTTDYASSLVYTNQENVSLRIPDITIDGHTEPIPPDQMFYVDISQSINTITHVLAIHIPTAEVSEKTFFIGSSQTLYVSEQNIFLTSMQQTYHPLPAEEGYGFTEETTILHKIAIDQGDITYAAKGEVPGHLLNQFSLDEYNGYLRIATTIGEVWDTKQQSQNNVYILDEDLQPVSALEGIAPGEKIYSARFMGDHAFLVTFKKVDPFFTIDLSDPNNPAVIGELKIPGYSDYLHPFDESHIIGVGKDTVEAETSLIEDRGLNFAWYQGLKIALFDVSDFTTPLEMDKIVIGDRGTTSPILSDHKAFLFDREKQLLVIPVDVYVIPDDIKEQSQGYTGCTYGNFVFSGAYIYSVNLENGFEYRGQISHSDEQYTCDYSTQITRSLYIENVLYTISEEKVKMNSLETLEELVSIDLS